MEIAVEITGIGQEQKNFQSLSNGGLLRSCVDLGTFVSMVSHPHYYARRDSDEGVLNTLRKPGPFSRLSGKASAFVRLCGQAGVRYALKRTAGFVAKKSRSVLCSVSGVDSQLHTSAIPLLEMSRKFCLRPALMRLASPPQNAMLLAPEKVFFHLAEESLTLCHEFGCGFLVVTPPLREGTSSREALRAFYLDLLSAARKHGVTILLENQLKEFNGRFMRGPLSEPEKAVEWIDALNDAAGETRFGLCLNTDVCNQCRQDIREYVRGLGKRIRAAYLPFSFDIRTTWREPVLALRQMDFDGVLACDARRVFWNLPDVMRNTMFQMVREGLDYLSMQMEIERSLRKYPSRVLFGSGLMFENYMRNYGDSFPPLFACDNNPSRWGSEICGVGIRSPEKLRELPPDCGVFICNRFYGETQRQLEEMGVRYIERFNDEMLPR